jgi:hypothetical protein
MGASARGASAPVEAGSVEAGRSERRTQAIAGRLAGFFYLLAIAAYVAATALSSPLLVADDFAATAQRIAAAAPLYRFSLFLHLVGSCATLPLAVALYVLLRGISRELALLALSFRLVETVFACMAVLLRFVGLSLYLGPGGLALDQRVALAGLLSTGRSATFEITSLFFALGFLCFFLLFLKSRFIPRPLSALGILASLLIGALTVISVTAPALAARLSDGAFPLVWLPTFFTEIATGAWLLLTGAKFGPRQAAQ